MWGKFSLRKARIRWCLLRNLKSFSPDFSLLKINSYSYSELVPEGLTGMGESFVWGEQAKGQLRSRHRVANMCCVPAKSWLLRARIRKVLHWPHRSPALWCRSCSEVSLPAFRPRARPWGSSNLDYSIPDLVLPLTSDVSLMTLGLSPVAAVSTESRSVRHVELKSCLPTPYSSVLSLWRGFVFKIW